MAMYLTSEEKLFEDGKYGWNEYKERKSLFQRASEWTQSGKREVKMMKKKEKKGKWYDEMRKKRRAYSTIPTIEWMMLADSTMKYVGLKALAQANIINNFSMCISYNVLCLFIVFSVACFILNILSINLYKETDI